MTPSCVHLRKERVGRLMDVIVSHVPADRKDQQTVLQFKMW